MLKWTFFLFLFLSSMFVFSFKTWLMIWVLAEVFSFLLVSLINEKTPKMKEVMWEYFLIQAMGSGIFLMACLNSKCWVSVSLVDFSIQPAEWMVLMSVIIKMGIPPFHGWYIRMMELLSYWHLVLLSTLGKVGPLLIMMNWTFLNSALLLGVLLSISSMLVILALWENSLRRFLGYSSCLNMCWVLISFPVSELSGLLFFGFYSLSVLSVISFLKLAAPNSLSSSWSPVLKGGPLASFSVLSLMALPPSAGFWVKVGVTEEVLLAYPTLGLVLVVTSFSMVFIYVWLFIYLSMKFLFPWSKKSLKTMDLSSLTWSTSLFALSIGILMIY